MVFGPFKMKRVAMIPARGGSKGVPRKNLQSIGGLSLVERSIQHALDAQIFDLIGVDSDDPEILALASKYPKICFWDRPAELATDDAKTVDVLLNRTRYLAEQGAVFEWTYTFQPTIPFRSGPRIRDAVSKLEGSLFDSLTGLFEVGGIHPQRMNKLSQAARVTSFIGDSFDFRPRQELEPLYLRSGWLYGIKTKLLLASEEMLTGEVLGFVNTDIESVNIDSGLDLEFARFISEKHE